MGIFIHCHAFLKGERSAQFIRFITCVVSHWLYCKMLPRLLIVPLRRRSKERSRGSGGGGTCRDTWALTPNTSTRLLAAATTSAPRSPCWHDAARKRGGARPPVTTTCPACDSFTKKNLKRGYMFSRQNTFYVHSRIERRNTHFLINTCTERGRVAWVKGTEKAMRGRKDIH